MSDSFEIDCRHQLASKIKELRDLSSAKRDLGRLRGVVQQNERDMAVCTAELRYLREMHDELHNVASKAVDSMQDRLAKAAWRGSE